ncbi:GMC oxidoreductase [Nocardia sp. NPDC049220]|uniref:GMC oxidoreductase n=1 Tax=Nocardia sp. NPDC049220 TaxID=3155273 RepID=UPI0033EBBE82
MKLSHSRIWRPIDLAREHALSTQAVRNYEDLGALPSAERTASGYRRYTDLHDQALHTFLALRAGYGHQAAVDLMRSANRNDRAGLYRLLDELHAGFLQERRTHAEVSAALEALNSVPSPRYPSEPLTVGQLARSLGIHPATLRQWERAGITVPPRHRATGYRTYSAEADDKAWNYESVLNIYRRIEDWHGAPDPDFRGTGGPVFVEPAPDPIPLVPATLEAAGSVGIPTFENQNGRMMESAGGISIADIRVRNGYRQSVFRSYVFPYLDRPNLTVLTGALVTQVTFDRNVATGVNFSYNGTMHHAAAGSEVVLSLGAIHTPKVLLQSGVGDNAELQRFGIPVVQHLPGVGRNLQDHPAFGCIWEYRHPLPLRNSGSEATYFWKSDPRLDTPDLQTCQGELPIYSAETGARFDVPESGWTLFGGVVRPKSRGHVRLTGPDPTDPVEIDTNMLSHPDDLAAAIACVELSREIGNSAPLSPFVKREVMPGNVQGAELERFVRDAASSYWHLTCSAKMGHDAMSVVDGVLKVHGIEGLRIADASIMPRVTTGNTMAPCVIIGERAADLLKSDHTL